jgi:hypothetical protein
MAPLSRSQIDRFLTAVGQRCEPDTNLYLLGGGALELLGGARPTIDLDYVSDEKQSANLQDLLAQIADEMQIELEAVPIAEFVPLPQDADNRAVFVGSFGNLTVYVFDPYTIALSKLDRGFDTDIEDILFLVQHQIITVEKLADFLETAVPQARQFDLDHTAMRQRLQIVRESA